jgi:glycosyltransferase involved in cell wall biosynthesis
VTGTDISVVIPCYNEGERIARSLATLDGWFAGSADILLIDDGSSDDTFAHAKRYAASHSHVRIHRLPKNGGKGAAIKAAIPLVNGALVLVIDADLAFDRASVVRVVDALRLADVAIGNRRHTASRYSVPVRLFGFLYRRHLVGLTFNAFVRALLQLGVRDTQCGLKAFRRSALQRVAPSLSIDGFAIDIEILLVVRALGLQLAEVPVEVSYDSAQSSVRILRSGAAMVAQVMRIFARRLTGHYSRDRVRASAAKFPQTEELPSREGRIQR